MTTESIDARLARLDERLRNFLDVQERANDLQEQQLININKAVKETSDRLTKVENTIANAGPALAEYTAIKNQVIGAGRLGKWIWVASGFIIGLVVSMKEVLISWFSRGA